MQTGLAKVHRILAHIFSLLSILRILSNGAETSQVCRLVKACPSIKKKKARELRQDSVRYNDGEVFFDQVEMEDTFHVTRKTLQMGRPLARSPERRP